MIYFFFLRGLNFGLAWMNKLFRDWLKGGSQWAEVGTLINFMLSFRYCCVMYLEAKTSVHHVRC